MKLEAIFMQEIVDLIHSFLFAFQISLTHDDNNISNDSIKKYIYKIVEENFV